MLPAAVHPLPRTLTGLALPASCTDYLCPANHPLLEEVQPHLAAYMCCLFPKADAPPMPVALSWHPLAEALRTYVGVKHIQSIIPSYIGGEMRYLLPLWQLIQGLEQPAYAAAVDRQLAALDASRPPLLTAAQLQHAACCHLVRTFSKVMGPQFEEERASDPEMAATLLAAFRRCADMLLRLEPHSPKSSFNAAHAWFQVAATSSSRDQHTEPFIRCLQLFQLCLQQAQQQRHGFYTAQAGTALLSMVHSAAALGIPVSAASLQAAVEAFRVAEAALKRGKALWPDAWERPLRAVMDAARPGLAGVTAQLRLLRGQTSSQAASAALHSSAGAMIAAAQDSAEQRNVGLSTCDGCGRKATGLRKCSR